MIPVMITLSSVGKEFHMLISWTANINCPSDYLQEDTFPVDAPCVLQPWIVPLGHWAPQESGYSDMYIVI